MKIVKLGNSLLREKSAPCVAGEDLSGLIKEMFATMQKARGVGLAAVQVGVLKRLFVAEVEGVQYVFVNPQIISTSTEEAVDEEGCLSMPHLYAKVKRPELVTVQAWDAEGKPFTLSCTGLLSRVVQHEYDHLDGVLFIDHCPPDVKAHVEEVMAKRARRENKRGRQKCEV